MTDRIKLAEAIGVDLRTYKCGGTGAVHYDFDPFTDANDDYAVLEWMRVTYNTYEYLMEHQGDRWVDFIAALDGSGDGGHSCCYQIGNNARAALKVLDAAPAEQGLDE